MAAASFALPSISSASSSSKNSRAQTVIERSLPEELIEAIVVRLPVKYVLQFKCVSKYWLRLISSPQFVNTHLSFSAKNYRFLLWSDIDSRLKSSSVTPDLSTQPIHLDYPGGKPLCVITIVGSVNGLICLFKGCRDGFFLWNPSTTKFKKFPSPTRVWHSSAKFTYGFGYDEVHDDYKIVGISCEIPTNRAQILSLRSYSWREHDPQGPVPSDESATLVNGKLHWINSTSFDEDWGIISFDLVDENFGKLIQLIFKERNNELLLGELGSYLSVVCNYRRCFAIVTESDVWVMKEYGVTESWMKLYTIRYRDSFLWDVPTPIYMSSKGEIWYVSGSTLKKYNPKDKSFTTVINDYGQLHAKLYIESLVCPFLRNKPRTQQ